MKDTKSPDAVIGILALQGAFAEHQVMLKKISGKRQLDVIQVRTLEELELCDGLIIPGGESTTIGLLAKLSGLIEPLREFIKTKSVWGTCAGAILLSQAISNPKKGGQELLGGVSVKMTRNGWGSQIESFEAPLQVSGLRDAHMPFPGVFIRAPVRLRPFPHHRRTQAPCARSSWNASQRRASTTYTSYLVFPIRYFPVRLLTKDPTGQ